MILENPFLLLIYVATSSFVCGFILTRLLTDHEEEVLALCLPVAFAVFALSTLPSLFLKHDFHPTSLLVTSSLVLISVLIQTLKTIRPRLRSFNVYIKDNASLFPVYALIFVFLVSQQLLIPFYGLGGLPGDWFGHYRMTHEFLTHDVAEFPLRLPLYQLLQLFFLSHLNPAASFGPDFYLYQLIQAVVGFSIFPVVHLLLKRWFDRRVCLMLLLALALVPSVGTQVLFPWPKMLATVYALVALYYYLKSKSDRRARSAWFSGTFSGLSILAHWLGAIYFMSLLIDFLWSHKRELHKSSRKTIFSIAELLIAVSITVIPIYIWGFLNFGFWETLSANWAITQKDYSFLQAAGVRLLNIFTTLFFPLSILIGIFRELPAFGFTRLGWTDLGARAFSWHFGSVAGNLTLTVFIYFLLKCFRVLKACGKRNLNAILQIAKRGNQFIKSVEPSLVNYIFTPILLLILLQPFPHTFGVAFTGLHPSVILLFSLIVFLYLRHARSPLLFILLFVESSIVLWTWQLLLHRLDVNYIIQANTSDPALLLLNEVVHYKREFELIFLLDFIKTGRGVTMAVSAMSQLGILLSILHYFKSFKQDLS